jgi:hypothetical protein
MLNKDIKLVYKKGEEVLMEINRDNFNSMPSNIAEYILFFQPKIEVGQRLMIPLEGDKFIKTSKIEAVVREKEKISFKTRNSTYSIEYYNFDKEKIVL